MTSSRRSLETSSPLKLRRERHGMGPTEFARAVGLSRQALFQIESGAALPRVDTALRIARLLDTTAEELFGALRNLRQVEVIGREPKPGQRVDLAALNGRWMAHPTDDPETMGAGFSAADGSLIATDDGWGVELGEGADSNVMVAGCDPALEILAQMSGAKPVGGRCIGVPCGNGAALGHLVAGRVPLAGIHCGDESGRANLRALKKLGLEKTCRVFHFSRWTQGWMLRPPIRSLFRGAADLADRRLRFSNREEGSGCRAESDALLRAAGVVPENVRGYGDVCRNHMANARRLAMGCSDVGFGSEAVARVFGLEFLPVSQVAFDLVVRRDQFERPIVNALLDSLASRDFTRRLAGLPGYDASGTGRTIAK